MAKDEAYYEAEKKIEEALQSGTTELVLGGDYKTPDGEKLTELPESLWELIQLKSLRISQTKITTLPDSLGQLTQLKSLDLSRNQLTTLPESLGRLTQLTSLNLSGNQLTALPDSLGQLAQFTELNLSNNQLMHLPEPIGQLTQLTSLDLSRNQLTTLPENIGQLTQLTELNLSSNQLMPLPDAIGQLTTLQELNLYGNDISVLPEYIGDLKNLEYISIAYNKLTSLPSSLSDLTKIKKLILASGQGGNPLNSFPECIRNMKQLEILWIDDCKIDIVPHWLSELTALKEITLFRNQLTDLPPSLAQLEHLEELNINENPLNPALQSAYDACSRGNYEPLWAYLRSIEKDAEPLYEAKLMLVGEGDVGKTTLLKALKGDVEDAPQEGETTTHGIDIHKVKLPHPEKDDVEIQLNAWDFGGQDVYRVTHQFFFSKRSLYILVWEPRGGVQKGQVEDWLNMIRLRVGDDARVIIVSTHCKSSERIPNIDKPVLMRDYPDMISGFYEVDSIVEDEETGEKVGIENLRKVIAEEAAKLEQMGMGFNTNWKAARDELIEGEVPRISYTDFAKVCGEHGLSKIDTSTLAALMHDLGYIVHYIEDKSLREDVVLKPQWLTKAIGFVLEDRATKDAGGILPDERLFEVWHDHHFKDEPRYTSDLYPFFLRLMEKYDVSYRLPDGTASLVAEHVPQVRPALPWSEENRDLPKGLHRITMICSMDEETPGLVPWMIVRTHDYAVEVSDNGSKYRLHWQKGMFLRYPSHGEAILEKRGRDFHIYTQAEYPEYFMNILQHTLKTMIDANWPGLKNRYRFTVPCPTIEEDKRCIGRFKIEALRKFKSRGKGDFSCQECYETYPISELLSGFEERSLEEQIQELQREMRERFDGLDSRIAYYFMSTMRAIADEAKHGPRLFTFRSRDTNLSWKQMISRPMELQLWCEHEGRPHPVLESGKGRYSIDVPYDLVVKVAPYANFALNVLKTVAPMTVPLINIFNDPEITKKWEDELDLGKAIIDKMPSDLIAKDHAMAPGKIISESERSGILALHGFLKEEDPTQERIGLHRVMTKTGDYRWLCKGHYEAWQPNIPDVIE